MAKNIKLEGEEVRLWEKLRFENSEYAYASIYDMYAQSLYNYGCKFTPDSDLVQDAIHDLFVRLWKNRSSLGPTSSIKGYLFGSVRREVLKNIERTKKLDLINNIEEQDFNVEISHEMYLIAEQHQKETASRLKIAIASLPARQKEAIFLRFYENLSFNEIATLMNVETRSIYKLVYKALDKLQNTIVRVVLITIVKLLF